jgi:hypothetical protein
MIAWTLDHASRCGFMQLVRCSIPKSPGTCTNGLYGRPAIRIGGRVDLTTLFGYWIWNLASDLSTFLTLAAVSSYRAARSRRPLMLSNLSRAEDTCMRGHVPLGTSRPALHTLFAEPERSGWFRNTLNSSITLAPEYEPGFLWVSLLHTRRRPCLDAALTRVALIGREYHFCNESSVATQLTK